MGTSDGFGAGWARSFRCSFSAWALRIFATISGLVFVGGGAGSFFFALGGGDCGAFGGAMNAFFSGFAAFSGVLTDCFVGCLLAGLGELTDLGDE